MLESILSLKYSIIFNILYLWSILVISVLKMNKKVGMLLQKRADTRGVGTSNLYTRTPHRYSYFELCTKWVKCMGVASGCS